MYLFCRMASKNGSLAMVAVVVTTIIALAILTCLIRKYFRSRNEDHTTPLVVGKNAYSFLDGFSGYNQVSIKKEDQHKLLLPRSGLFMLTKWCHSVSPTHHQLFKDLCLMHLESIFTSFLKYLWMICVFSLMNDI